MSIANQTRTVARQRLDPATATKLAECSSGAASAFALATSDGANVTLSLEVADAIADLRELFDKPEVRCRIEALQDTPLGFRTDRDPKLKNKNGEPNTPYQWPIVRDASIEASLRGLQLVGNQWNIIAGRFYGTKEGFEYLIPKVKGLSEFKQMLGVPRTQTGGAIVECKATWKMNGRPDSLEVLIPVRTDSYSGADQILGKATRKFLARCYRQMCGANIPEGESEAGDEIVVNSAETSARLAGPAAAKAPPAETTPPPTKRPAAPVQPSLAIEDPHAGLVAVMAEMGATLTDVVGAMYFDDLLGTTPTGSIRTIGEIPLDAVKRWAGNGDFTPARESLAQAIKERGTR